MSINGWKPQNTAPKKIFNWKKILLAINVILLGFIFTEQVEHSRFMRGFTCQTLYIQARVDDAKVYDSLIEEERKSNKSNKDVYITFFQNMSNYHMEMARKDGGEKCVVIEETLMESFYIRLRNFIKK